MQHHHCFSSYSAPFLSFVASQSLYISRLRCNLHRAWEEDFEEELITQVAIKHPKKIDSSFNKTGLKAREESIESSRCTEQIRSYKSRAGWEDVWTQATITLSLLGQETTTQAQIHTWQRLTPTSHQNRFVLSSVLTLFLMN